MNKHPNPGSDEAVALGCVCPRMDNEYGRLEDYFTVRLDCPLHGDEGIAQPLNFPDQPPNQKIINRESYDSLAASIKSAVRQAAAEWYRKSYDGYMGKQVTVTLSGSVTMSSNKKTYEKISNSL